MKSKTKRRLIGGEKSRQTLETASFCVRINLFVEVPQTRQLIGHPTQQKAQQLVHGARHNQPHKQEQTTSVIHRIQKREEQWRVCTSAIISIIPDYCTIRHNFLQKKKREKRTSLHTVELENKSNTVLLLSYATRS